MGTEIATATGTRLELAGIVSLTKSLQPHELDRHRAAVSLELEVLSRKLDRFGWDQINEHVRTRLRQDWCDTLADYTIFEIQQACKEALGGKASEAMNEEKIKNLIIMARGRRLAAIPKPMELAPPPRATAQEAQAILDQAGFKVNRMAKPEVDR